MTTPSALHCRPHSPIHTLMLPTHPSDGTTHSYTFTHRWYSCREQFEVKYVTQGHSDMRTGDDRNQTTDLSITERPSLRPQPSFPIYAGRHNNVGKINTLKVMAFSSHCKAISSSHSPSFFFPPFLPIAQTFKSFIGMMQYVRCSCCQSVAKPSLSVTSLKDVVI